MKTENVELLIIRHLKRNTENEGILRRMIGKYYALRPEHIDKRAIFDCLFRILTRYDLLPHSISGENIQYFFTDMSSFEPNFADMWDCWIHRAKTYIRNCDVSKLPRYPEPAWFRHFQQRRNAIELKNLALRVKPAIYTAYYPHEKLQCYKLDLPFSQYGAETIVLCRVDEGLALAKSRAMQYLETRIADALKLPLNTKS
jgi:hypothetical protein